MEDGLHSWSEPEQPDLKSYESRRTKAIGTLKVTKGQESKVKCTDTVNADNAIEKLKVMRRPFFLALGFRRPHLPFIYPERFEKLYERREDMPANPEVQKCESEQRFLTV